MSRRHPLLVLASGSPRRRDLLSRAGLHFDVLPADVDESAAPGESPVEMVQRLAMEKALAVARSLGAEPRRWVLGADTIVVVGERILGKPADPEHAVSLLRALVGRVHSVWTGVAVCASGGDVPRVLSVESRVHMRPATAEEVRAYVATGEPLDKAGAYALQGEGRRFVARVEGSETNVIGLPLDETLDLLRSVCALGATSSALATGASR